MISDGCPHLWSVLIEQQIKGVYLGFTHSLVNWVLLERETQYSG
jgi:hypothetical protein